MLWLLVVTGTDRNVAVVAAADEAGCEDAEDGCDDECGRDDEDGCDFCLVLSLRRCFFSFLILFFSSSAVFGSGDGEAGIAGRDDRDVVAIRGGGIICSGVVGAATGTAFAGVTPVAAASTGGWFAFGGCVPADRTALIEPLAFLTSLPVYEPLACATSVPPPPADENFDAAPSTLAPYRSSC